MLFDGQLRFKFFSFAMVSVESWGCTSEHSSYLVLGADWWNSGKGPQKMHAQPLLIAQVFVELMCFLNVKWNILDTVNGNGSAFDNVRVAPVFFFISETAFRGQ